MKPSALDLWWLADHAEDLARSRFKGTARPWRQPAQLDAEGRRERDAKAAAERRDRTEFAIGEHPAPMHVDVMDVFVDLVSTADDVAERVAQAAGVERLAPASSSFADPSPYLRYAAAHLSSAALADPEVAAYAEREAARLRTLVSMHLGELTTGQTLATDCMWCAGRTAEHPEGGVRTLRVRDLPGGLTAIVCHNDLCEPPAEDVGTYWHGRPAWPMHEWEWLAQRIEVRDKKRAEEAA